tara:strand:+ start:1906 stop:2532 length:627 start_codon:yes stop_codon:yes gene_type:complete
MIELFYWSSPNGRKISIMLEELNVEYKITTINISKREQFKIKFKKLSPASKIPAIIDHQNGNCIFESCAILIYLANKYNKFMPKKKYWEILQWLIYQSSQVGPYLGQAHQFLYYHPGKSSYAEKKYINYAKKIYKTLNKRLERRKFLVDNYSIADIATWPWIARYERQGVNLKNYKNLLKWYKLIGKRKAVIEGYNPLNEKEKIPLIN